jgi:hypothetical protein
VTRCQRRSSKPSRRLQKISELDLLIAGDAGNRRLALEVAIGEFAHHRRGEARLIVEHIMRNLQPLGDAARILDVLSGATGSLAANRLAVVVELKRDTDDVVAVGLHQGGHDRRVDAAGHGDHDARIGRRARKMKTVKHWGLQSDHGLPARDWNKRATQYCLPGASIEGSAGQTLPEHRHGVVVKQGEADAWKTRLRQR